MSSLLSLLELGADEADALSAALAEAGGREAEAAWVVEGLLGRAAGLAEQVGEWEGRAAGAAARADEMERELDLAQAKGQNHFKVMSEF